MAVSDAQLRAVVQLSSDISDTQSFRDTAALIISEDFSGSGLSADRLYQIELYIAAHFAQLSDGGNLRATSMGESRDVYAGEFGRNFESTRFGQMALALDSTGTLQALQKQKARFTVV